MRPDWDEWALNLAEAVSTRGDCRRRQVGAVILDTEHRVAGLGYNGSPPGGPSCLAGECPRGLLSYSEQPAGGDYSTCSALHAEHNAVLFTDDRQRLKGATIYVTDPPCHGCSLVIQTAGIIRVVVKGQ